MCTPMAVGLGAIGGMSAITDAQNQNAQADAQNRASEQTNARALESAYLEQMSNTETTQQEMDMLARKDFEAQRVALRDQGAINVAVAERGASGLNAQRISETSMYNHSMDMDAIRQQQDNIVANSSLENSAIGLRYQNNLQTQSAQGASMLQTGLGVLTGGLAGANTGMALEENIGKMNARSKTTASKATANLSTGNK